MSEKLHVVRAHKDTVFRMLFREKKELLELYNALNDSHYENPEDLLVCTLENAVYMNVKNDVSFMLGSELNLYEHQASYNPNMPLRDLIYIAKQLEKYIRGASIYSTALTKIPVPRFVVFYNGTGKQPERRILKLSDAFEKEVTDPELELKVLMLNINLGHNQELLKKCRMLKEYCTYVALVRKYSSDMQIEEAVERAVTECIQEGVLSDFLSAQRAEVVAMSIFEYNEEEELKKIRASEFSVGRIEGREEGRKEGIVEGRKEGIAEGRKEGIAEGKAGDILELLMEFGNISERLYSIILQETDLELLKRWLKAAAKAGTLEEFMDKTGLSDE